MNSELLERVLRSPRLPSLPMIALQVIELVQKQDVNIKQIAQTISHDPALSGKILKTVNSSFYGQAHSISTISHALVILGLNSVKTMALGFTLVSNLKEESGGDFDHVGFWRRSLYTATAARSLAQAVGLPQHEEVFLGGLLQDLGMLAMSQALTEEYAPLVARAGKEHRALRALECERFDLDHPQVGAALAETWNLPPVLVAPIRFHEDPESAPREVQALARCVSLGNTVADLFMEASTPGETLESYYQLAQEWFNLGRERAEPLLSSIHEGTVEMRNLFDLPTGDLESPDVILARANEALLQISLQSAQQTTKLQAQNEQLAQDARTDALTGAANRRHFDQFVIEAFQNARSGGEPLSVLFLDVDFFKQFNDTYGHPVGDRVLVQLGNVLRSAVPDPGLVARYGGEEFTIVLPGTDRAAAAKLAEQMRQTIEGVMIRSDEDEPLNVTASIGIATARGDVFKHPQQLVRAADQAVYAAKRAGRNCVRVFAPKPKAA